MRQQLIDAYMKIFIGLSISWDDAIAEAYDRAVQDIDELNLNELRVYLSQVQAGKAAFYRRGRQVHTTLGVN